MSGMALAQPCAVAFTQNLARRMAPDFGNLSNPRMGDVPLQNLDGLKPKPGIDHHVASSGNP